MEELPPHIEDPAGQQDLPSGGGDVARQQMFVSQEEQSREDHSDYVAQGTNDMSLGLYSQSNDDLAKEIAELKSRILDLEFSSKPDKSHDKFHPARAPLSLGEGQLSPRNENNVDSSTPEDGASSVPSPAFIDASGNVHQGIKHIKRRKRPGGSYSFDSEDLVSAEQLSRNTLPPKDETWLTIMEDIDTDNGQDGNQKFVTIADDDLIDFLRQELRQYIDHVEKKSWSITKVTLTSSFNAILLNWPRIAKAYEDKSTPLKGATRARLGVLLEIIRAIYPSMTELQAKRVTLSSIEWKDIEILFTPGSLVVANWETGSTPVTHAPQLFKVSQQKFKKDSLCIVAWLWDLSGTQPKDLGRTMFSFQIEKFEFSRAIESLSCYPVEFFKYEDKTGLDALRSHPDYLERKQLFLQHVLGNKKSNTTLRYKGDILSRSSEETIARFSTFRTNEFAESSLNHRYVNINDEIIIDTRNYLLKSGSLRLLGVHRSDMQTPLCSCSLCLDDSTKRWHSSIVAGEPHFGEDINDLLLAPRVFGYALARKMWCQFSLKLIKTVDVPDVELSDSEFILPEGLEKSDLEEIEHMVKNHTSAMAKGPDKRIGDTIGGKGESLILLFHGVSGTGKTLLAESLARSSGKPLYKVGTSDIGLEVSRAEKNLKAIFELAEAWDALLLIDEADVLLDARGTMNEGGLAKNSLVSVLLREVEYFKGVLIMTTNRVVAFDPAILSRIHHAVNFTTLTITQQQKIWHVWLNRLESRNLCQDKEKIEKVIDKLKSKKQGGGFSMNGREIRNIFIVAQTLAFQDGKQNKITADHLWTAYNSKVNFRSDTEKLHIEAESLLAKKPA